MNIPFSPPDISQLEINEIVDAMKSKWITTGPRTKLFEKMISEYCGTPKTVAVSSCTGGASKRVWIRRALSCSSFAFCFLRADCERQPPRNSAAIRTGNM